MIPQKVYKGQWFKFLFKIFLESGENPLIQNLLKISEKPDGRIIAKYFICFLSFLQVKNFGRSGRTKYTHLTDQDTTEVSFLFQTFFDKNCL